MCRHSQTLICSVTADLSRSMFRFASTSLALERPAIVLSYQYWPEGGLGEREGGGGLSQTLICSVTADLSRSMFRFASTSPALERPAIVLSYQYRWEGGRGEERGGGEHADPYLLSDSRSVGISVQICLNLSSPRAACHCFELSV